jgi:hypothetical protein
MKSGGHMDYHGSRAYAPDPPSLASGSWLERLAGPLAAWAEQLLAMLLKPGARDAAETVWLAHGDERHFSVLGSGGRGKQRRSAEALWPDGEARFPRPIARRRDDD